MIGIVILNYNDYKTVQYLYELIKDYKSISHIVIVDNCSKDESYKILSENCECDVIRTEKNGGYAYGNNYGIRYLIDKYNCDYIIVSNPDVEFKESFVKSITGCMQSNPDIGIMSGVMTDRNGKNVPSEYGITTSYKKALIECFYLYRHYQMHYAKNKIDYSKTIMYVQVVWGSLFIISREAYEKIHGFDEGTFLYHEENIISERMKNAGYKEAIFTKEQFVHKHAVSISKGTSRMSRHKMGMKSQYYFQTRYHNLSSFQKKLLKAMMSYSVFELHCVNGVLSLIGK